MRCPLCPPRSIAGSTDGCVMSAYDLLLISSSLLSHAVAFASLMRRHEDSLVLPLHSHDLIHKIKIQYVISRVPLLPHHSR